MNKRFSITSKIMDVELHNDIGHFKLGYYQTKYGVKIENHFLLYKQICDPLLLRIQSGCLSSDIFHDLRCDCRTQLLNAMKILQAENGGLIIYTIEHDGKGHGFFSKLQLYKVRDLMSIDQREASRQIGLEYDTRDYLPLLRIIEDLGIKEVIILSSNQDKAVAFENSHIKTSLRDF